MRYGMVCLFLGAIVSSGLRGSAVVQYILTSGFRDE